ncbi:adenylyltransferase/cytidyltransferase family protein [Sphingobacterium sp. HJSM2_6]|uniref:adenylyltransferase/cytidyltransferase family protein n=1 Tax=Sphingobacterium sp. HJSM2_6 TaxID=3366264 RepID=UPI003BD9022F
MKVGITFGVFDLLHAGHIMMLQEAKNICDYLIVGLNTDPSYFDPNQAKPAQSVVERFIQLEGCRFVNEIIPYETEQDLQDLLQTLPIDIRIIGEEYKIQEFSGKKYCLKEGIEIYFNKRSHRFSSSALRQVVAQKESEKLKIA